MANAVELRLAGDEIKVPLTPLLEVYEDKSAAMDIDEVVRQDGFAANAEMLRPGHTHSAIWLKLDVANASPGTLTRWLEIQASHVREVSLFQHRDGQWRRFEGGTNQPFSQRPVMAVNAVFPIRLEPREATTVYLRVASPQPIALAPVLWDPLAFRTDESRTRLLDGLMLGGLVIMALLGVVLLFMFRDRAFLFNALATATYFFGELSAKGYSFMYLWPNATDWVMRGLPMYALLGIGFHLLFLRDLLVTRRDFPRINRLLLVLLAAEWLPAPGILFGDTEFWARLSFPQHFPITVVMMLIGIYAASKGIRAARYYTAGYAVLALGSLIQGLSMSGFDLPQDVSRYALPVGMMINNMFLLTSVVGRIMQVRKEKDDAQQALLTALAAHESHLGQQVRERTADLNAALIETRKANQTQSRLVAYIGHDLRAPLATIVNYVHLLGAHVVDAGAKRYQATIERSAMHQLELIDDLVEYARGELEHLELTPAPTYLHDWLNDIAAQAELLAMQYGNRFELKISGDMPPVVVFDPKRLRQILINLLQNAAKFTNEGDIRLCLHAAPAVDGKVKLAFAVEDTGPGIPPEDMERIFLPFERRESEREGSGLGLTIARKLAQAMGGKLALESEPNKGSRFSFSLTVDTADEAEVLQPMQAFAFPEPFGSGKTLLVADDNAANLDYLREVLSTADFDCVYAHNGIEALQLARERRFDALILDQFMPGMSGWDVLRELHQTNPESAPPAILCSAMPPQRPEDFPPGLDFYAALLKPVSADKLLQTLQSLFEQMRPTMQPPPMPSPAEQSPPEQLTEIPAAILNPLRDMIADGCITEIEEWAESLANAHPEHADFAHRIRDAAQQCDMGMLARLLDRVSVA
ncbi:MAG TPA: 7TM diverse intracellular signaling domain-containing protein [Gallionella sp.]|nr:7TM diverse intracellular signaling domain-containing protein [Gallionella sp.]